MVCYMHGYEYNVFTGKLENMKSWKKEDTWLEQNPEWRKSGDLVLYPISEKNGSIFVDVWINLVIRTPEFDWACSFEFK